MWSHKKELSIISLNCHEFACFDYNTIEELLEAEHPELPTSE